MRQTRFFLILALIGLFGACSSYDEPALNGKASQGSRVENRLTVLQAESIASAILSEFSENGQTRSDVAPEVEYVLRSSKTRSVASNDTIAYVFNYPDNGGFVMISPDPSLDEPLVAYSDKGNLDINDEFVMDQIIFPLESYIDFAASSPSTRSLDPPFGTGVEVGYMIVESVKPQIIINLDQYNPWNKVVVAEKGLGHVAGCVPVASALVMSRCKSNLTFKTKFYNFKEITKAIVIQQGVEGVGTTSYSYSQAVDDMAQFLYDFGITINADYQIGQTDATSGQAILRMIFLGYSTPFTGLRDDYDADILKTYIKDGNLVYVTGTRPGGAHAWVADGYQIVKPIYNDPLMPTPKTTYAHFNWGWGGNYNGYFSGSVYTPFEGRTYTANQYSAVKLEY